MYIFLNVYTVKPVLDDSQDHSKWSPWTSGRLIKHLYKTTTNKIWSLLADF